MSQNDVDNSVDSVDKAVAEIEKSVKVEVVHAGDWSAVKRAAYATAWRLDCTGEPSSAWKRKILLARHSPIRALVFEINILNIPYWVSVHLVRHKFGVEHFVSSQRDDRHSNPQPRAEMPQGTRINHKMVLDAEALIAISKKRLCLQASPETRAVWLAVWRAVNAVDRDMASVMQPECWWCGDHCPEMRGCGMWPALHPELAEQA